MRLKQLRGSVFFVLAAAAAGCVGLDSDDPTLRTPGVYFDDKEVERRAKRAIRGDEGLDFTHINVASYDGIVLLTGQVAHQSLRRRAEEAIAAIPKIRRVHNEIQVGGTTSLVARANDNWLTTKVVARFLASDQVPAARIKVVVENGVAYLIGVLAQPQADIAADVARRVVGVNRVVTVFEYL